MLRLCHPSLMQAACGYTELRSLASVSQAVVLPCWFWLAPGPLTPKPIFSLFCSGFVG